MAKCNDNSKMSAEAVSACMRRCEAPLQEINQVVQQEVGGLQVRLEESRYGLRGHFEALGRYGSSEQRILLQRSGAQHA